MKRYKLLLSNGVEQVVKVGVEDDRQLFSILRQSDWLNCIGVLDNDIEVSMYIRCKDVVSVCPIPNNGME